MDDFSSIFNELENVLGDNVLHNVPYERNNTFNNPNKLPLTQIHFERLVNVKIKDPPENLNIENLNSKELNKYYETKKEVLPALHKSWIPENIKIYNYLPYYFSSTKEENSLFIEQNELFIKTLAYLMECNYHEFWCIIVFEPAICSALTSFLINPVLPYEILELDREFASIYETVFSYFYWVYERLITFRISDVEHIPENVGLKYLLDKKLLSLPIVITLSMLYKKYNREFVNKVTNLYFNDKSQRVFLEKEVEETINHLRLVFQMVTNLISRKQSRIETVPISIEPRPAKFSLKWVYSVVNYLLHSISTLNTLFEIHKPSILVAFKSDTPTKLPETYEHFFVELYDMLDERDELQENPELTIIILNQIGAARSEFLNAYNAFISYCLDQTFAQQGNVSKQEELIETYLKLMNCALEYECFICDYHAMFNIDVNNEMFNGFGILDSTRTDYIMKCVNSLPRSHKLSEIIKQKNTVESAFRKSVPNKPSTSMLPPVESVVQKKPTGPSSEEIDLKISFILDMFPHLGDGFILKCLEAYNYKTNEVINAILEDNLPPHITDIPVDLIRIPPEPEPAKPILAYRGKKPTGFDDALKLLDDKKAKNEMKTYVLDGIKYGEDYDPYDDEYDDREDDVPNTVYVADNGNDEISRFNPNYVDEDLASDTSYSEDEYDDDGKPVSSTSNGNSSRTKGKPVSTSNGTNSSRTIGNKGNFCEDPAVIRARREAQYGRGRGRRGPDVVGKPKGQGQEASVVQNRQKKGVNKSNRANHNRKGGAQFKRSRGMMPS